MKHHVENYRPIRRATRSGTELWACVVTGFPADLNTEPYVVLRCAEGDTACAVGHRTYEAADAHCRVLNQRTSGDTASAMAAKGDLPS